MKKIDAKAVQIVAPPPVCFPILAFHDIDKILNCNYNSDMMNYRFSRFWAFTLAEVLITLAIIGIVAALTIPNLIFKYQEKQTVSRLTKAYSTINNAYQRAKIDNGELSTWGFEGNSTGSSYSNNAYLFWEKITPYLKIDDKKTSQDDANRFEYKRYFLTGVPNNNSVSTIVHLADGMTLSGGWISNYKCNNRNICGDFHIDINGITNLPNTIGKDIFYFYIYKDAIIPMGTKDDRQHPIERSCNLNSTITNNGYGCTAWVIYNKNMDYLRCNDLSWNYKHSCNE